MSILGNHKKALRRLLTIFHSPKQRVFLSLFAFLFVSILLIVPNRAQAAFCDIQVIGDVFKINPCDIFLWVINIFLALIQAFMFFLVSIAATFLTFVIVDLNQYVGYFDNQMVRAGWGFVRDIVNMFFAIILAVIAIGTILGMQEYNLRRLLPKLIIAALLVNFSLFLGAIVINISNVLMGFFITSGFGTQQGNLGDTLINALRMGDFQLNVTEKIEVSPGVTETISATQLHTINLIFSIIFAFAAACLFVYMSIQFVIRIVALWAALILSPIAMISTVLPQTSGYYNKWWNDLLRWSLFGVFASFFLWLSVWLVAYLGDTTTNLFRASANYPISPEGGIVPFLTVGKTLLQYILVFVFLQQGMAVSKSMASEGAAIAGHWTGRAAGAAMMPIAASVATGRRLAGREVTDRTRGLREGVSSRLERIPLVGSAVSAPIRAGLRSEEAAVGEQLDKYRKELSLGPKAQESLQNRLGSILDKREKSAALLALAEKGKPLPAEDYKKSLTYLSGLGKEGMLVAANPTLALQTLAQRNAPFFAKSGVSAADIAGKTSQELRTGNPAVQKAFAALIDEYKLYTRPNAALVTADTFENDNFVNAFMNSQKVTGTTIGSIMDAGHALGKMTIGINKFIESLGRDEAQLQNFVSNNRPTADYLQKNPMVIASGIDATKLQEIMDRAEKKGAFETAEELRRNQNNYRGRGSSGGQNEGIGL